MASQPIEFERLFADAGVTPIEIIGGGTVASLSMDSRTATKDALFVCMPSANSDTQSYIGSAAANGAMGAIVFESRGLELARQAGIAVAQFSNEGHAYSEALWRIARAFYSDPTAEMQVVGVTGTNGKTTTAWLLRDMIAGLGIRAGYLGTLGFQLPKETRELSNTTPFVIELFGLLDEARSSDVKAMAMEVSSHALEERRADGVAFDAAVFTNLTQDHLDFHGSMAKYERSKRRLFTDLPKQSDKRFVSAFNLDDPVGLRWCREHDGPRIGFGKKDEADLVGTPLEVRVDRIRMKLRFQDEAEVEIPLGGSFNVENCLAATAGMLALGYEFQQIIDVLPKVRPVPGRFEAVPNDRGIGILVDYAHTPDALEKLLDSVRDLNPKRIITVFGCGGDRDRTKRPKMARAASERSEFTVVTSDNPRTEDPNAILAEVVGGVLPGRDSVAIVDRREAVANAVRMAQPGDVVVIAGKGHENYQIVGRTKYPMDDRELAREGLS